MKIKVKDERFEIRLKLTHQELMIINEALKKYRTSVDVCSLNNRVFDCDEFSEESTLVEKVNEMINKIGRKTEDIDVY
jgi:hypothetical protein